MLTPIFSNQFKKDYSLAEKHRDHPLHGDYEGTRECHIQGDWLLVYESNRKDITFFRTGTHSDLF
jgi:mRNA interferase YafQ